MQRHTAKKYGGNLRFLAYPLLPTQQSFIRMLRCVHLNAMNIFVQRLFEMPMLNYGKWCVWRNIGTYIVR